MFVCTRVCMCVCIRGCEYEIRCPQMWRAIWGRHLMPTLSLHMGKHTDAPTTHLWTHAEA